MAVEGVGSTSFSWGDPGPLGTGPDRLQFTAVEPREAPLAAAFALGELRYFNGVTMQHTVAREVTLEAELVLAGQRQTFSFPLTISASRNQATPGWDGRETGWEAADAIILGQPVAPEAILVDGVPHGVHLRFAPADAQGYSDGRALFGLENAQTGATVYATLVALSDDPARPVASPSPWHWSSWYGLYRAERHPWVWSEVHGWNYVADRGLSFDTGWESWVYTAADTYPYFYRFANDEQAGSLVFFDQQGWFRDLGGRFFWDFKAEAWTFLAN